MFGGCIRGDFRAPHPPSQAGNNSNSIVSIKERNRREIRGVRERDEEKELEKEGNEEITPNKLSVIIKFLIIILSSPS